MSFFVFIHTTILSQINDSISINKTVDSIVKKEKKKIILPPFQLINKDTIILGANDELVYDEYSAMGKPGVYDALHSFNYRRSDKFGGYINVKINAGLERIRKKGFNSDIKKLFIQINPETLTVYWFAIVGPSTDNFSYNKVDSRGSAGGGRKAVEKQLPRMHGLYQDLKPIKFLEFNENVTACFTWNCKPLENYTSCVNIQQYFYKYRGKIESEKLYDLENEVESIVKKENEELIFEEFDIFDPTINDDVSVVEFKPTEKQKEEKQTKKKISEPKVYKVKSGDNLSKIAQKHSMTVSQLQKLNNLKDDKIQIGQVLKVTN
jgi:hypothetical protein